MTCQILRNLSVNYVLCVVHLQPFLYYYLLVCKHKYQCKTSEFHCDVESHRGLVSYDIVSHVTTRCQNPEDRDSKYRG
jgi:hypothetical protein